MTDDHYFGGQEFEVLIEQGAEQCCEHCRNGDWPGRFRKWLNEIRAEAWDEGVKSGLDTGISIAENVHEHGGILDLEYLPKPEENPYRPNEK